MDMKVGDGEVTWSSVGGQVGVHRSPEQSDLVIIIILYHIRVAEVVRACERRSPKSLDSDENFNP